MLSLLFPHSEGQWQTVVYFFLLLVMLLGIAEIISRQLKLPQEFSRKIIHITVGLLVVGFALNISEKQPITFLSLLFTIINAIILKFNLMPSMGSERKSYGTVFYPLTIFVAALALWDHQKILFLILVLVLALADAMAAIVGNNWKNATAFYVLKDKKTLPGTIAMCVTSALIIYFLFYWDGASFYYPIGLVAIISGLFIAVAETISVDGSDNISIGIATILILSVFLEGPIALQNQFLYGFLFGGLLSAASYKYQFLNLGGALITFVMAVLVFGIGGWAWTIPILVFFITSSLLSTFGKKKQKKYNLLFEKNSKRDGLQVLANGGMAMLCTIIFYFYPDKILFNFFVVSLAAANADTWATELGVFSKVSPRLITTFKTVGKGRSGAISFLGIFGAFMGALLVAISPSLLGAVKWNFTEILLLSSSGLMASLVDSLLGATVQVQYRDFQSGKLTERQKSSTGEENKQVRGLAWLNNDWVNFISIASAFLFYMLLRQAL